MTRQTARTGGQGGLRRARTGRDAQLGAAEGCWLAASSSAVQIRRLRGALGLVSTAGGWATSRGHTTAEHALQRRAEEEHTTAQGHCLRDVKHR